MKLIFNEIVAGQTLFIVCLDFKVYLRRDGLALLTESIYYTHSFSFKILKYSHSTEKEIKG